MESIDCVIMLAVVVGIVLLWMIKNYWEMHRHSKMKIACAGVKRSCTSCQHKAHINYGKECLSCLGNYLFPNYKGIHLMKTPTPAKVERTQEERNKAKAQRKRNKRKVGA